MTKLHALDAATWLDTIWQALECYREDCIPEGVKEYDEQWGEVCTAMAWVTEQLGVKNEN